MAFASGPASFQRYFVNGRLPDEVNDHFMAAVTQRGFDRSAVATDDTQCGWIGPGHLLETELSAERIACGPFAHLALRVDQMRPPANVVRAYLQVEEQAARQAHGHDTLSKTQLRIVREAARDRAAREARAGAFRRMSATPVLFDLAQQTVYLGGLGATLADKFMLLFRETFGATLAPATPDAVATRLLAPDRNSRALESLTPFTLVTPPDGDADTAFSGHALDFLGKELLTWLWYQVDSDAGPLSIRTGDEITVMIERTLRLKCDFGLTGVDLITADCPTNLPEARAALTTGKQPVKMGLLLGTSFGELRFVLDGPRLAIGGLTLPDDEPLDPGARRERRFELIADTANLVDALFELFLQRRVKPGWRRDLARLTAWAAGATANTQARSA